MNTESTGGVSRIKLPGIIAGGLFVLSTVLSVTLTPAAFNPSDTDREQRKQELLADRTLLMLQLSKCRSYTESIKDPYICPSTAVAYKAMAGSSECAIVEEAARETNLAGREFSIPLKGAAASPAARSGAQGYLRGSSL